MKKIHALVAGIAMTLLTVSPALAAETSKIYNSGLLVLLFVGFCALLIVVQVLPAILSVMGMTEKAAKGVAEKQMKTVSIKKH